MSDARIPLNVAVARLRADGAAINAYEWYRQHAHRDGKFTVIGCEVPVVKSAGRWWVRVDDLERGLAAHQAWRERRRLITADYDQRRVLHGDDGERQYTESGGYYIDAAFHFRWYIREKPWKSDGTFYCNTCFAPADQDNDRPECVRCGNGLSCRANCTLTRLTCVPCASTQAMPTPGP